MTTIKFDIDKASDMFDNMTGQPQSEYLKRVGGLCHNKEVNGEEICRFQEYYDDYEGCSAECPLLKYDLYTYTRDALLEFIEEHLGELISVEIK